MIKFGSKVRVVPKSRISNALREDLRDLVGLVYKDVDKYGIIHRMVQLNTQHGMGVSIIAKDSELKWLGDVDDPEEVKRICISWGANPFNPCWDGDGG